MTFQFRYHDRIVDDFVALSDEMNRELTRDYDNFQSVHARFCRLDGITDVVLAYDGESPIGCASLKAHSRDVHELKRVFVRDCYRRTGVAEKMMELLERKAKEKGVREVILETGKQITAAVNLYAKQGYVVIDNFGQYEGLATSVCMKKDLGA